MSVNVGFVGCGGIAHHHLRILSKIPEAKVTGLYDVNVQQAKNAQASFGGEVFTDYDEMLKSAKIDALYVCLPPFAHGDYEMKAVKKGLHLFVEKPVHISLSKARDIASAIRRNKLISTAGYQDRYLDIIKEIKSMLKEKKVGLIVGKWIGGLPGVAWWRHKKESGGQILEQTTHIFDMCRYLFGEVKSVHAVGMKGINRDYRDYDVEDASCVSIEFKNGMIGTVLSACYLKGGWDSGIDIYCADCVINYKERSSYRLSAGRQFTEKAVGNDASLDLANAFLTAIKKRNQNLLKSSYEDAVKSLELSISANKSLESGTAVRIK